MNLNFLGINGENLTRLGQDYMVIFFVSIPISLLLYLYYTKHRHKIVVDLGNHKWLIK